MFLPTVVALPDTDPMEHTDCPHLAELTELRTLVLGLANGLIAAVNPTPTSPQSQEAPPAGERSTTVP